MLASLTGLCLPLTHQGSLPLGCDLAVPPFVLRLLFSHQRPLECNEMQGLPESYTPHIQP